MGRYADGKIATLHPFRFCDFVVLKAKAAHRYRELAGVLLVTRTTRFRVMCWDGVNETWVTPEDLLPAPPRDPPEKPPDRPGSS